MLIRQRSDVDIFEASCARIGEIRCPNPKRTGVPSQMLYLSPSMASKGWFDLLTRRGCIEVAKEVDGIYNQLALIPLEYQK